MGARLGVWLCGLWVGVAWSVPTVQQQLDVCGMSALEYDQAARHQRERAARMQAEACYRGGGRQRGEGTRMASMRQQRAAPLGNHGDAASTLPNYPGSSAVSASDEVTGATIVMPGTDMGSIRITDRRRAELREKFGTAAKRAEAILTLRRGRIAAAHAALSCNTWSQNKTIMRMWFEYCELKQLDPTEFGVVHEDAQPKPSQLKFEDGHMADFAVYVTENRRKAGAANNTGNTAASYVSHVRTYYEFRLDPPRRVGGTGASEARDGLGHALRRCLKGLRKRHPSNPAKSKKASVLRSHLIAVRALLDMRDPFDAMIWAFMCTAWQGGRRSGELVRAKSRSGPWNAKFDMHRGRLAWDWSADGSTCHRVRIALGPDKTDPTGEEGHTVFLPHDGNATINAASAIATMLAMDPTPVEKNAETALFRDTRPGKVGKPMTYGAMMAITKILLVRAGMTPQEAGCHSYRRGTATALAHVNAPSYVIKGIGIWGSDAYLGYIDATESGAMEQAMLAMAEASPLGVLGPRGISRGRPAG